MKQFIASGRRSTGHHLPQGDAPADAAMSFVATRRRWTQNVLPLVTSLAGHAAMVLLLVFTIRVARTESLPKNESQDQPVKAKAAPPLEKYEAPSALEGRHTDTPFDQPRQSAIETASAQGFAPSPTQMNVDAGAMEQGATDSPPSTRTLGRSHAKLLGKLGGVSGAGEFDGGPGAGPLAPWGPTTLGRKDVGSIVFKPAAGRKIVFICDATGTMITKLTVLKKELLNTIGALQPGVQSYNIVFFLDAGNVSVADEKGLMTANEDNLRKTQKWLEDVTPIGSTNPIPAIEKAFTFAPDVVYFLSDGEFNNLKTYDEVIAAVRKGNVGKRAVVNTILFETADAEATRAMERIAAENGGAYTFVREDDIGKANP